MRELVNWYSLRAMQHMRSDKIDKIKKQPGALTSFTGLLCVTAAMGATSLVPTVADQALIK